MFIPRKDRLAIFTHVFTEGCIAAKIDYKKARHGQINCPNIYVVKLMKRLTSKKLATRTYTWGWAYWVLNDAGIEYLRNELHLPEETVPNTFKRTEIATVPEAFRQRSEGGARRGGRGGVARFGANRDFNRSERSEGEGSTRGRGGFRGGRGGRGGFRGGRGGFRGGDRE